MPYIKPRARDYFDDLMLPLLGGDDPSPGELNYVITKLLLSTDPVTYSDFNALIGVLESVKLEFYRRQVVTFEEKKIKENGDL